MDLISALEAARAAEKAQALFYRALAAEAEDRGDDALSERFNELHADEQHHVSRLSVRLMELGAHLHDIADLVGETVGMEGWEAPAALREQAEVRRYEQLLGTMEMDDATRGLIEEILDTERHHAAELGGQVDDGVMLGLRGRRALVTGGSRGVGRATVLMLARAGVDVGVGYLNREADAREVVEQARALGVRAFAQASDVATPWGAEMLFERCLVELGGVDLFVANAGIWVPDEVPVAGMTDGQWERTMTANLTSVFQTVRLAARFVSDGGRIVVVSSTAGQRGEAHHADYAASKGALISFTKSVAVELAERDVTVNCVAPGWIDTEMVQKPMSEGRDRIEQAIPLGRVASADDVAGPIVFLCSALARHVTGEILNVNGGSVLCG